MTKNTLPDKLTCCLPVGSEHDKRTMAERWIIELLKNCDVAETRKDYTIQMLPNQAVFMKKEVRG